MGGCKPQMAGCSMQCGHKQMVMGYREEYQRQNDALWERSGGYTTEYVDNKRQLREAGTPLPQFKDWLIQNKRPQMDESTPVTFDPEENARKTAEGMSWASNPVRGAVRDGASFLRFDNHRDGNEALLLGCAMNSKGGLEALRALDPREFYVAFHQDVAKSITWLADRGRPHDAAAVTSFLREHDRLPLEMDPTVPLFEVDPDLYGLGAWQTYSVPADKAPEFAQAIRSEFRSREMEAICTRGANSARAAVEYGDDGLVDRDLVGEVRTQMAKELTAFPPMLDGDLQPMRGHSPGNIDTQVLTVATQLTPIPVQDLQIPQMPQLSVAGREALSRG